MILNIESRPATPANTTLAPQAELLLAENEGLSKLAVAGCFGGKAVAELVNYGVTDMDDVRTIIDAVAYHSQTLSDEQQPASDTFYSCVDASINALIPDEVAV